MSGCLADTGQRGRPSSRRFCSDPSHAIWLHSQGCHHHGIRWLAGTGPLARVAGGLCPTRDSRALRRAPTLMRGWTGGEPVSESGLHMAHRHVVEGRQRIRKQVCLISRLHRSGSDRLLPGSVPRPQPCQGAPALSCSQDTRLSRHVAIRSPNWPDINAGSDGPLALVPRPRRGGA